MMSIVIAAYNEEAVIRQTLSTLPYGSNMEVIVVDGASTDKTVELAKQFPVKVIECSKNRALQMNKGAGIASGDILLFLHADCILEEGALEKIKDCLAKGYIGGCLSQKISSDKIIYRFIEASGNIRARLSKIFYGDQAIFVRRDVFFKLGGFDNLPLFEDILFSKKLMREGETAILAKRVFASPRRWQKNGIVKTTVIFWLLTLGFYLGLPYNRLEGLYRDIR